MLSRRSRKSSAAASRSTLSAYRRSVYTEGQAASGASKCDIALPCATQNELNEENAKALIANGVQVLLQRALTCRPPRRLLQSFQAAGVFCWPGKGCQRRRRSDLRSGNEPELPASVLDLRGSRRSVCTTSWLTSSDTCITAAEKYGHKDNLVMGANIGGFEKIADAMLAQGVC